MEALDFEDLVDKRLKSCKRVLTTKASVYESSKDRLHNFKDGAFLTGQTPAQYALSLMTKHQIAIRDKINANEELSSGFIAEKFGDVINYMLLLEALVAEKK